MFQFKKPIVNKKIIELAEEKYKKYQHLIGKSLILTAGRDAHYIALMKEISELSYIAELYQQFCALEDEIAEYLYLSGENLLDEELNSQLKIILKKHEITYNSILSVFSQKSVVIDETNSLFLEIRACAGGQEAGLFSETLLNMYLKYCERKKWLAEIRSLSPTSEGGFREAIIEINGQKVLHYLQFESGVHRVQRIPQTETQGRVHTSTCSISIVSKNSDDINIELNPGDLRIDTYRSSGAGGQKVNKTDSAVRVVHLPTGIKAECQNERSQHKNKEQALEQLKAKLYQLKKDEQEKELSDTRKAQIGFGDRHEKIRTYNFIQKRITDHRVPITIYRLEEFLDGNLDLIINSLLEIDKTNASK